MRAKYLKKELEEMLCMVNTKDPLYDKIDGLLAKLVQEQTDREYNPKRLHRRIKPIFYQ